MPERQSSPGEATEQQVTPVPPDGAASNGGGRTQDDSPSGSAAQADGTSGEASSAPSSAEPTPPSDEPTQPSVTPAGASGSGGPTRPSPAARPTPAGQANGSSASGEPTDVSPAHGGPAATQAAGDARTPGAPDPGASAEGRQEPAAQDQGAQGGAQAAGAQNAGAQNADQQKPGGAQSRPGSPAPAAQNGEARPTGAPSPGSPQSSGPQNPSTGSGAGVVAPGPKAQQAPTQQAPTQQAPTQQAPTQQAASAAGTGTSSPAPATSGAPQDRAAQNPGVRKPDPDDAGAPTVVTPLPDVTGPRPDADNTDTTPSPPAGTRPSDAPPGNGRGNGPSTGGAELFGSWDDQSTRVMPRVPGSEAPTQRMPPAVPSAGAGLATGAGVAAAAGGAGMSAAPGAGSPGPVRGGPPPAAPGSSGGGGGDGPVDAGGGSGRRPRRTGLLVAAVVVGIVVLAYLGDLLFSMGSVPRGVTVAGQAIGGMSRAAAIERLQTAIEPRSGQPVQVTAGPVRSEIDPKTAGLSVDYDGTLDQAGAQPLNPITRVSSFFTDREVGVVNQADQRSVRTAMEQLAPLVDRDPKDGTVRFDGLNPVPVSPEPGQRLDVDAAVGTLERQWASGVPVALPLIIEQAATTPDDVQKAIDDIAKPAVSAPLTVTGEGANATVTPEDIAQALTFKADPDGAQKLVPLVSVESITDVVKPQLAGTEKPGVDATLDFAVNPPRVVPSQDGRGIDYEATFANLLPVLTGTGPRQVPAVYAVQPPDITTAKIQSLGSAGEISSFTTGGFASDSGQNIKRAAEAIDGTIVQPGETFSLNDVTAPRDASRGYIEAGIIEDGHPARGVGGGVSQLATTLYNASYFAGMVDVEHKEHSYYISRYPVAREATVFEDLIDVKFRNDGPTAVLIKSVWTPSNVTVKFFGTKRFEVSSAAGPKTNFTQPQVVNIPPGQPCSPSKGSPGFTATDTRTMRDVQTGETTSKTRTVRYNPQPIVKCGG